MLSLPSGTKERGQVAGVPVIGGTNERRRERERGRERQDKARSDAGERRTKVVRLP